jgi:hypothetical protein
VGLDLYTEITHNSRSIDVDAVQPRKLHDDKKCTRFLITNFKAIFGNIDLTHLNDYMGDCVVFSYGKGIKRKC